MNKIFIATLAGTLALAVTGCDALTTPDGSQGVVTKVISNEANDTTTLYVQKDAEHGGELYLDTMLTSENNWQDCVIDAVWPQCLKNYK